MATISRLQRTLKSFREQGYVVEKTERWNAFAKKRQDLFGIFDVLAYSENITLGVQVTDMKHQPAHITTILKSENAKKWVQGKNRRLLIHAWDKRKGRWNLRVFWLQYESGTWSQNELSS